MFLKELCDVEGNVSLLLVDFFEAVLQVHSIDTEKKRSGLVKTVEETPPNDTASNLTDLMPSTICQHLSSASYMEDQVFFASHTSFPISTLRCKLTFRN